MGAKISLTSAESAVLDTLGDTYEEFIRLPILRGSDADDFASHIRVLQAMVLSRPTYRALRRKVEKNA